MFDLICCLACSTSPHTRWTSSHTCPALNRTPFIRWTSSHTFDDWIVPLPVSLCRISRTQSYLFPYLHKIERKNINLAFIIGLEVVEHLLHKWVWTVASICTEKFQQFSFKQPQNYKLQKQRYAISFRNPSFWNPWIAYKFISAFRCLAWLRVPAVFRLCSLSWAEQHL